jgi:hypothetical protein
VERAHSKRKEVNMSLKVLSRLAAALFALLAIAPAWSAEALVVVYKTPNCGCCVKWIEHLREAGLSVEAKNAGNLDAVRRQLGVPPKLAGCHTATVNGYVVEGHVPASQVVRLLKEKPEIAGISVPGMPIGSPGMEGPGGKPYQVLSWTRDGKVETISIEQPREQ